MFGCVIQLCSSRLRYLELAWVLPPRLLYLLGSQLLPHLGSALLPGTQRQAPVRQRRTGAERSGPVPFRQEPGGVLTEPGSFAPVAVRAKGLGIREFGQTARDEGVAVVGMKAVLERSSAFFAASPSSGLKHKTLGAVEEPSPSVLFRHILFRQILLRHDLVPSDSGALPLLLGH